MLLQELYKEGTIFRYLMEKQYNVAVTFDTDAYELRVRVTGMDVDETVNKSLDSDSDEEPEVDFLETVEEMLLVVVVNLHSKQKSINELLGDAAAFMTEERLKALEDKGWGFCWPGC